MTALTPLMDGVWEYTDFVKIPGATLPARTTVLRDRDGGLLLYGPLPLTDEIASALDALGEVRTIVGPSLFHHMWLGDAKTRWPSAQLLGSEALMAKRSDLDFDGAPSAGFVVPGIRAHRIEGMPKMQETVLLHEPSGALVCSDLAFRVRDATGLSKWVLKMAGAFSETLSIDRLWRFYIKDRESYEASLEALLQQDFDAVVIAHGDPVLEGGKAQLEASYRA